MFRVAPLLADPFQPFSAQAEAELSFMSGVDGGGDAATDAYWPLWGGPGENVAHKWGSVAPGSSGGVVSYYFYPTANWTSAEQGILTAGLALWSAVANITFVQTDNFDAASIAFNRDPYGNVTGTAFSEVGPAGNGFVATEQAAETSFDTGQYGWSNLASFTTAGGYGVDTVIHEEGHLLGLGHAGPYNGSADPLIQQFGPYDSRQWSLMSYINPWQASEYAAAYPVAGTSWGVGADGFYREPTTWMPLDILAAQRLYGVATSTPLSGGQTFGFNCNIAGPIGQFFDFTINAAPVVTLWDEGVGNTLDVSGFSAPAVVDLRPGAFSSVDGMTNDIGIAWGTAIDNAVGGAGDTTFVVNGRSDSIVGGGGWNEAVFASPGGNYADKYAGPARIVSGAGAQDTLVSVGALAFVGGASTVASNVGGSIQLSGGRNALFLGAASFQVQLGGADTLVATSGYTQVTAAGAAGAAGDWVFAQEGGLVFQGGATPDTVVGGAVTVLGGSAGITAYGSGELVAHGGAGYNVFASFAGSSETVQGGAGGGLLVGGAAGNNHLSANGGSTIIFGGGAGDQIDLTNAASDTVVLGGGAETVDATAAGAGDVVYAGSGNDLVMGGAGEDYVAVGQGNDTLSFGGGINAMLCINGRAGGVDVVTDWDPSRDYVFLIGYGGAADAQAAAAQVQAGGNTLVTLADRTQIWFMGTHGVAQSSFA